MPHRIAAFCFVVCALAAFNAIAADEDFEVRVHRAVDVGHRERASGRVVIREQSTLLDGADEQVASDQSIEAVYAIEWKVLEASRHGTTLKAQGTVIKLHKIGVGVDTVLLDEGAVFTAHIQDGRKTFATDKGPVAPEAAQVLQHLIWLDVKDGVAPESVMGTKDRQKVGGTWNYDSETGVNGMAASGWDVKPQDFKGRCKLEAVKEVLGERCLDLTLSVTIDKMNWRVKKDDPTNRLRSCEGKASQTARVIVPVDPKRFALSTRRQEEATMTMEYADPDGAVFKVRTQLKVDQEQSIEQLKK